MSDMTRDPDAPSDSMDWDAIARFLAGESSDAEIESVSRWMADHPDEAAALMASHEAARRAAGRGAATVDVNAAWQRVGARLDEAPAARPQISVERGGRAAPKIAGFHTPRSKWASPAIRAAAAVAIIAT